jgi:DNA repair exonuclease SbcCD ATPase subunit
MGIKRILHVSDVHIRSGDTVASRYDEYRAQIDKLLAALSKYDYNTTMIVVTGDLFHEKSKMGPCGQLLAQQLFRGFSKVAIETVVIRGNHDYRQDAPNEPDLIKPFFEDMPENVTYLDESGLFQREDIEIGLVAVQDTLVKGAGAGIITNLPDFPTPSTDDPTVSHSIALFHGSFGGALLQNGTDVDSRCNYPLEWIQGYSLRLFGDIHVQQVHNAQAQPGSDLTNRTKQETYTVSKFNLVANKNPWGYAGSLIQQNFGESLWGHGFVEWDVENSKVALKHIPNDFGYVIATVNQADEPCVKLRIGKSNQYIPIKTIVTYAWFPESISLRFSTKARNSTQNIQAAFEEAGIVVKDTGFVEENNVEETDIVVSTAESKEELVNDLTHLNSPDTWIKFFTEDAKIEDGEWSNWVKHPHLLTVPTDVFPADIKVRLDKRNVDFAKMVDKYLSCRDTRSPVRHFRIHHIEFAWLLCFGADNYLNLDGFTKKVSLISGNNGSGKSSLLEILCLAIFGESFPSRYNKNFSAAVINQHKPQGESAFTRMCFSIDGKKYWISRTFDGQPSNPKTLWQRTVKLIDDSTSEIIKQSPSVVNEWIEQKVGKYEHFLMTTIVSQSNDSDFFNMKATDQKSIIDSLLQLDVVEEYNKILHQSSLDHKYALLQLETYEAGRKDVSKLISTMTGADLQAMEARKAAIQTTIQQLQTQKVEAKSHTTAFAEKVFQTPIYDYMNDKKQLQSQTVEMPEGELSAIKQSRLLIRDRLAVLRTKRYKPTKGKTVVAFDTLEANLLTLKNDRLKRGGSTKLYDSKAHEDWLLTKSSWYKTHQAQTTNLTLRELEAEQATKQAEYDELKGDIDPEEHKPVTEKVLKGLQKQHDELTNQKQELEQSKKHLYKTMQTLKAQLTPDVKESIQLYQAALIQLQDAFGVEPKIANERLTQVKELNMATSHLQKDLLKLQAELADLIKIKFNKDCTACTQNPYKHKRESLEQEQVAKDNEIKLNNKKAKTLLNSTKTYEELKSIYDAWQVRNNPRVLAHIEDVTRLQATTDEHKSLTQQIADLNDDIEDVGFESQTNVNDFYNNEKRLNELENIIGHLKFSQQEQEYNLSKELSLLDQQIQQTEEHTAIAYTLELTNAEASLKQLDTQVELHDSYNAAINKLKNLDSILEAYPHYTESQNIEQNLKPLTQELQKLDAELMQAHSMNKQMAEAKTFEQQISTFRLLLEGRSVMIAKLSEAYNKYTSWLYPTKVGPAIENAVNEVLNSIALPRPITLDGEWDKDKAHFVWFVRDGNSRPPYEKCSGAQRFFIGLAIRIALGRLGSSNMINDQIFLDEGFTACDAETMEKVPTLLNNLLKDSNKLNAVFMVSHLDQLKSAAAASIPIIRGATSSKLTIGERQSAPKGVPIMEQDAPQVPAKKRGRPKKATNEPTIEVAT